MLIQLFQFLIFSFVVSPTYSFRIQWTVPSLDISAGSSAFLTWVDYNISLPITVKLAVQNPDGNLAVVYTWDSINPSLSMYFVELPLTTQPGINYYFIAYQVPSDYGTLGPFTVKSSLGQIPYTSVIVNVGAIPTSSAVGVSATNPYSSRTISRTISGFIQSSTQPAPTHGTSDLSSTGAQSSLSTGAIAGISVGATIGVIIGLLSFFLCYIKRKKKLVQQQEPTALLPEKNNMGAMSIQMNAPQFVTTPPVESQYSNNFLPPYPEPFNPNNQQQHQQVIFSSNIESTTDFTSNASSVPLNTYNGDNLMYGKTMVSEDSAPEGLTVNDPTPLLLSSNNSYPVYYQKPHAISQKPDDAGAAFTDNRPYSKPHENF